MVRLMSIISLIFLGIYLNVREDDCSEITEDWKSEKEAITQIENTPFYFSDSVASDNKSWIKSAKYYSCDEEFGYLLVKSEKKTFMHQKVPIVTWNLLKGAKSMGGYYNFYIKNKF